jgi:hypothetical protein
VMISFRFRNCISECVSTHDEVVVSLSVKIGITFTRLISEGNI